ncbi:MAG: hypothetical protein HYR90_02865 [Candidatus Andersenbacteria bacterium]|nr:hypothetical protein [Candidatus Andersenbacteria bacterium]MBI3251099.1 hypothetical protein [Candidatus Andersenbacteria bacterium]
MKRVKPAKANWIYVNAADSPERLQAAYDHVFTLARQNLLRKQQIRHISLWMITKDTYGIMKEI